MSRHVRYTIPLNASGSRLAEIWLPSPISHEEAAHLSAVLAALAMPQSTEGGDPQ